MNPDFFGDSFDLVKRVFCRELSVLGYSVSVDPMFTGDWSETEQKFYRLIGAQPIGLDKIGKSRAALFLDPDTGVMEKGSRKHVSFDRLVQETLHNELVFAFDQSYSRRFKVEEIMRKKLSALHGLGCHGLYYNSHACFIFVSRKWSAIQELQDHFLLVGLPQTRFLTSEL